MEIYFFWSVPILFELDLSCVNMGAILAEDENLSVSKNAEMVESTNRKGLVMNDEHPHMELYVGMGFESKEAVRYLMMHMLRIWVYLGYM